MDEKLSKIRTHVNAARHALPQTTTDDPALFEAVEHLIGATDWLLDVLEQINDQRVGR